MTCADRGLRPWIRRSCARDGTAALRAKHGATAYDFLDLP